MTHHPLIYHLCCTVCGHHYLSLSGDMRSLCFSCDATGYEGMPSWQVVEVWSRAHARTPWVNDSPCPDRFYALYTPAAFLERLRAAVRPGNEFAYPHLRLVTPGLTSVVTTRHALGCGADDGVCTCPQEVTYAMSPLAAN
jgi:hypothetical protein